MAPKNSRAKWLGRALFSSGGGHGGQAAAAGAWGGGGGAFVFGVPASSMAVIGANIRQKPGFAKMKRRAPGTISFPSCRLGSRGKRGKGEKGKINLIFIFPISHPS